MTPRCASIAVVLGVLAASGCETTHVHEDPEETPMGTVRHLSPEGLHRNPAFSQVVQVDGPHRTIYVGGQNAVDAAGGLVGPGDLAAQAEQVATNLEVALAAAAAGIEHVVKWTVYLVEGQSPLVGFQVFRERWGQLDNPPTISVVVVTGLAHPHFLMELDAVAIVPSDG